MSWLEESRFLELWYEKTQNPYFVWSAYQFFRKSNRPVPKWVLHYLDESATDLLQGKEPLEALNFNRDVGENVLKNFYLSVEHVYIITEFAELIETENQLRAKQKLAKKYQKSLPAIEKILLDAVRVTD